MFAARKLLAAAAPMQPIERTPESGGSACDRAIALAEVLPRRSEEQLIAAVNCPLAHFLVCDQATCSLTVKRKQKSKLKTDLVNKTTNSTISDNAEG